MQLHWPFRQRAFGPHGDGLHGSDGIGRTAIFCTNKVNRLTNIKKRQISNCSNEIVNILTRGHEAAAGEGISREIFRTSANRCVINNIAERVRSTGSGTRVSTFLPDTSLVSSTVRVNGTFWSAVGG